eukprot:SAG31_NODE_1847_length_7095_cov_11.530875_3_plen_87_part_00
MQVRILLECATRPRIPSTGGCNDSEAITLLAKLLLVRVFKLELRRDESQNHFFFISLKLQHLITISQSLFQLFKSDDLYLYITIHY